MAESNRENAVAEKNTVTEENSETLPFQGAGCEHSGLAATFKIISQTLAMRPNH